MKYSVIIRIDMVRLAPKTRKRLRLQGQFHRYAPVAHLDRAYAS